MKKPFKLYLHNNKKDIYTGLFFEQAFYSFYSLTTFGKWKDPEDLVLIIDKL